MPISFDAASGASLNTASWAHTVGGSNRVLIVGEFDDTGGSNLLTAVKWNTSESFTKIAEVQSPADRWASLWYLLNPTAGTFNIDLTTTAGAFKGSAISLAGVAALDVSGTQAKSPSGSGDSSAVALTVAANAWIVSLLKENSGTTVTWTNATEQAVTIANGLHMADGGPFTGSTTTTGAYVGPTSTAMVCASFTVAGGGGGGGKPWLYYDAMSRNYQQRQRPWTRQRASGLWVPDAPLLRAA